MPSPQSCTLTAQPRGLSRLFSPDENGPKSHSPEELEAAVSERFYTRLSSKIIVIEFFSKWHGSGAETGAEELMPMFLALLSALLIHFSHNPLSPLNGSNDHASGSRAVARVKEVFSRL
jgi:hypothetical protein